jgi:hypothetical protein
MDLSKIITITGKPGLYRVVAQGRQATIVEALADGKRMAVPHSMRVSALEEISMYTTGDDVPLVEVLKKIHELEKGGPSIDPKESDGALFAKLGEVLPEYDRERIYASDVRKLFTWYGVLRGVGEFDQKDEKPAKEKAKAEAPAKAAKGDAPAKKAAKKAPAKKAAAPGGATTAKAKATTVRRSAQRGA